MLSRRELFHTTAMSALAYGRVLGANDRIGIGLIGCGNRGRYVMGKFQLLPNIDVRALCDVYGARVDEAKVKAPAARTFSEHERLLELKEVDAVLIGSPDHWHQAHCLDAMQSGKDVYVEKPLCRTLEEAPSIVRAARQHQRICQVGMQQRSGPVYLEAQERFFSSGQIGRVNWVECVWNGPPPLPYTPPMQDKPANLDWLRFLGPARYRPWNPRMYFSFRSYLDLNGGRMTDFGHHWLDVVHMYLGERSPHAAVAAGQLVDTGYDKDAPDSISALFKYPGFTVSFQSVMVGNPAPYGIAFYGDKGKLFIHRNMWVYTSAEKGAVPIQQEYRGDITEDHVRNFVQCCASRQLPRGDVALAAISIQPPLLAVQSYLEKRRLRFDAQHNLVLPS